MSKKSSSPWSNNKHQSLVDLIHKRSPENSCNCNLCKAINLRYLFDYVISKGTLKRFRESETRQINIQWHMASKYRSLFDTAVAFSS